MATQKYSSLSSEVAISQLLTSTGPLVAAATLSIDMALQLSRESMYSDPDLMSGLEEVLSSLQEASSRLDVMKMKSGLSLKRQLG